MGFDRRALAETYTPRDHDTLEDIATRESDGGNALTFEDIARFNWGTDDAEDVGAFLRDNHDCYWRHDADTFAFSADSRGSSPLLIPAAFHREGLALNRPHTLRVRRTPEPPVQFEACCRVRGVCFELDKSFIRPVVADDLAVLDDIARGHPDAKIMIFGHTDRTASHDYNKRLSERRAKSTFAFITNDVDAWERLYNDESWGIKAVQEILDDLGHDPGGITGSDNAATRAAVESFQGSWNAAHPDETPLDVDGVAGRLTRAKLFEEYMGSKHDVELEADRFMDPKHIGCSEFNPMEDTDGACEANRRVTFFFFHQDRLPHLPCSATAISPCRRQASQPDAPRHQATFECSFYDSIAKSCACEGGATPDRTDVPGIDINRLDQWFIPGPADAEGEICRIRYDLTGQAEKAGEVTLEVYASNYCSADLSDDGSITFAAIAPAIPIYTRALGEALSRPGESHDVEDWRGECEVATGALQGRDGATRFVNVAFSPYCVHLRYLEEGATATDARILLNAFWPKWDTADDGSTSLNADSLRLTWTAENADLLSSGRLQIFDKTDQVVFEQDLTGEEIRGGTFTWDGVRLDGNEAQPAEHPYRYQIQARTGEDQAAGFAIAAMHTEVRLFVHPETGTNSAAERYQETDSLELAMAPVSPTVPDADADEDRWYQYKLAMAGFHPGPVDGTFRDETRRALREFQRSCPANTAAPYTRLEVTGNKSADTRAALARVPDHARPLFGNPEDRTDLTPEDAENWLTDNDEDEAILAFIDDRHAYTEAKADRMFMGNYHGDMDIGDARVARDAEAIPRPFIPLMVDLPLRPRESGLDSEDSSTSDTTRKAIGPLRVNWTFTEVGQDLDVIDTTHAGYQAANTRSKKWVEEKVAAAGDTQEEQVYTNCPVEMQAGGGTVAMGGIRPVRPDGTTNTDEYYKAPFGHGDLSLVPWRALDDSATKTVLSIVHDDLLQDAAKLFDTHRGRAGMNLQLSRMAGDGYRFSAQVGFAELPGGASRFPNREVLENRYPIPPRAHTAKVRMWRKTAYRGYIGWAPSGEKHWPAFAEPAAEYYRAAHLHFVHEGTTPATPHAEFPLGPLGSADALVSLAEYRGIVTGKVTDAHFSAQPVTIDLEHVWPYLSAPHYGIPRTGAHTKTAGQRAINRIYATVFDPLLDKTWRLYRADLIHLLLKKIEEKHGLYRGHLLVEFRSTPQLNVDEYECSAGCDVTRAEVTNGCAAGDLLAGTNCPNHGTCGGTFRRTGTWNWARLPHPAVGVSMGATWLFTSGAADVWAHEMGHHRHLEHAQSRPGSSGQNAHLAHDLGRGAIVGGVEVKCGAAPGAKLSQHDSEGNPAHAGVAALDATHPDKDRGWDRSCIMSYNHDDPLYFCGKCILKNRGWAVEHIANPAGNVHD
jgi:peptidoglycan hydrolase-like protein with peptidoglycan-binding domain